MRYILIENMGCDDTTYGVAKFSDKGLIEFVKAVHELNKNSTYCCMPKIRLYELKEDDLICVGSIQNYKDYNVFDNGDVDTYPNYPFYLGDKCYVLKKGRVDFNKSDDNSIDIGFIT